jgi:hypothetical protein
MIQCPACAKAGVKTVLGHIDHMDGRTWGAPTPEQIAHDDAAREWSVKNCDSNTCIRGREHARKANWHDNGFCMDCAWNPYNHTAGEDEGE